MCNVKYLKGKQNKTDFIDNKLATNKHFCIVHTKIIIVSSIFEDEKNCSSRVFLKKSKCKFNEEMITRFIKKNWLIYLFFYWFYSDIMVLIPKILQRCCSCCFRRPHGLLFYYIFIFHHCIYLRFFMIVVSYILT